MENTNETKKINYKEYSVWVKRNGEFKRCERGINELAARAYAQYYQERGHEVEIRVKESENPNAEEKKVEITKKFEVGKKYGAWDAAVPAIKIIKRTDKTATVESEDVQMVWTMRIKKHDNGDEYMTDSKVPASWQDCYTYEAKFEPR